MDEIKTTPYDVAGHLSTPEDAAFMARAQDDVARAVICTVRPDISNQ